MCFPLQVFSGQGAEEAMLAGSARLRRLTVFGFVKVLRFREGGRQWLAGWASRLCRASHYSVVFQAQRCEEEVMGSIPRRDICLFFFSLSKE